MAIFKDKSAKNDGKYIFADFTKGLYYLDTPRSIGEQLHSLALIGGRNIWTEKGALVSQPGYLEVASLPREERVIGVTTTASGNNSFFIITISGNIYLYTGSQGLKKYKSTIESLGTDVVFTRRNKDLIIYNSGRAYIFGAYYKDGVLTELVTDVTLVNYVTHYEADIPKENLQYFWNDKEIVIGDKASFTVQTVTENEDGQTIHLTLICNEDTPPDVSSAVTINERTNYSIDFIYHPDNEGIDPPKPDVTLVPTLMALASNRLFIVNNDGNIYYSQIGNINAFNEAQGAGYFGGFENDSSKTLSIEDYMNGVLICKENGIYFLEIGDQLSIKKISQVGQQYASDHVIVGEKVYAYDCNSGGIVNAVAINVFGSMVVGKPVISSEFLNTENSGINSVPRWLTYNATNEVFILYYGHGYTNGLVLTNIGTLFPRELDINVDTFIGFNQGVMGITSDNRIVQDFKKGSVIPTLTCIASFEPIGLRDNRMIISTLLEITELNGIEFNLTTENGYPSYQSVKPSFNLLEDTIFLPPLIYSDDTYKFDSFSMESKWAEKNSNVTRVYAPMSGRAGVSISLEFPANTAFCLAALRLPDFSQGN